MMRQRNTTRQQSSLGADGLAEVLDRAPWEALNGLRRTCKALAARPVCVDKYVMVTSAARTLAFGNEYTTIEHLPNGLLHGTSIFAHPVKLVEVFYYLGIRTTWLMTGKGSAPNLLAFGMDGFAVIVIGQTRVITSATRFATFTDAVPSDLAGWVAEHGRDNTNEEHDAFVAALSRNFYAATLTAFPVLGDLMNPVTMYLQM